MHKCNDSTFGRKSVTRNGFSDINFLHDLEILAVRSCFSSILAICRCTCALSTILQLPTKRREPASPDVVGSVMVPQPGPWTERWEKKSRQLTSPKISNKDQIPKEKVLESVDEKELHAIELSLRNWSILQSRIAARGDWKCGSGKCDTVKIARVENAGMENAGVSRMERQRDLILRKPYQYQYQQLY